MYQIHKDNTPEETVAQIQKTLSELGMFTFEVQFWSFSERNYSVRLKNVGFGLAANGKGVTKKYALASAYAEIMERLQNGFLIGNEFGAKRLKTFYPDEIFVKVKDLLKDNYSPTSNLLTTILGSANKYRRKEEGCIPYYNVFDNKIDYLPHRLIIAACRSNGLCAGNTPEEALCQGICEIFERYIHKKIFHGFLNLPTIPLESIKNLQNYSLIEDILKKGYKVMVKDCTLGGTLPVLGIVLLSENNDEYRCIFGSDPIFEVALQRCCTELFQGLSSRMVANRAPFPWIWNKIDFPFLTAKDTDFFKSHKNIVEFSKSLFARGGKQPNNILLSNNKPEFSKAFQAKFTGHKSALKFLTDKVAALGFKLYVRDNSFLGFPAFQVYIPGMSELFTGSPSRFDATTIECLSRLKKSSCNEVKRCARYLEEMIVEHPTLYVKFRTDYLSSQANLIMDESSDIHEFDHIAYLVACMFYFCGEYKKAFKYLKLYLEEEGHALNNLSYYVCALAYINLKMKKVPHKDIYKNLYYLFGKELAEEVASDLRNPREVFKYVELPECGDCSLCPVSDKCFYDEWYKISMKMREKISKAQIKQENLSRLFH
jgi:ribosomal protein S12 methylthiotransferase accessory factor